jgi:hypothetical protein
VNLTICIPVIVDAASPAKIESQETLMTDIINSRCLPWPHSCPSHHTAEVTSMIARFVVPHWIANTFRTNWPNKVKLSP